MMRSSKKYPLLALIIATFLIELSFAATSFAVSLNNENDEIKTVADDLQYQKDKSKLVGYGNVVVTHGETELTADEVEMNTDTKEGTAKGHVMIREGSQGTLSGENAIYNFDTKKGSIENGKFFQVPWYGYAAKINQVSENKIKASDVYFTSCDMPDPHYDVHAKNVTIYPGDKMIATNVTFRILGTPVFWWPYLSIPLNNNTFINVQPGYSNDYGAYALFTKGFSVNKNINGKLHADYYQKRGVGVGPDFSYKFEKLGEGELKLYGIRDKKAPDERQLNPFEESVIKERDRGRVSWKHRAMLDPKTTLLLQFHELSDDRFLQDFFEREYRAETNPQSFITITRNSENYSLLANVEKRVNRFETVGEKLPELVFTWLRKPIGGTNFYYTSEEGLVNFNQTNRFAKMGPSTTQVYTDHEISYPLKLLKYYSLVPFVNARDDFYTKNQIKQDPTNRFLTGGGFDLRTRFYKTWDIKKKAGGFELNGLRHILQPVIQYNSIKLATEKPSTLVNTTRGDNLGLQDIITFGAENRIQTKRYVKNELQRVDLVSFNTYLDLSFGPGNETLRTRADKFTEARVETILRPYDWFSMRMETRYDMVSQEVRSNNLDLIFKPGKLYLILGHRFTHSLTPITMGTLEDVSKDNQLTIDSLYTINDKWSFGGYVRYEFVRKVLQEWEIRAERDLHDWILDFGFNVRDSEKTTGSHQLNQEAFFQLRLKAYPQIDLRSGHRASYAQPKIGDTVSGSDEEVPVQLTDWQGAGYPIATPSTSTV